MEKTRKKIEARHPRATLSQAARAIRQWLIVFILIAAGAQSALAQTPTPNFTINGVVYHYYSSSLPANIVSYTGTAETLTIPDSVINGGVKYRVGRIGGYYNNFYYTTTVTFSGVKTLTIQGSPTLDGTIKLPDAETLVFEKSFNWYSEANPITCPKLTEIHFKGEIPALSGDGSKYFANNRIGQITAYIAGKTQEECDQMKQTMAVWGEFKDVVPYIDPSAPEETVNVYVTVERAHAQFKDGFVSSYGGIESRTYTISRNSDFWVKINKSFNSRNFRRILVNGRDVTSELTWYDELAYSDLYWIREIANDTYIHIEGSTTSNYTGMWMYGSEGGTVTTTVDGNSSTINPTGSYRTDYIALQNNSQLEILIEPAEGYEFYKAYLAGMYEVPPHGGSMDILGLQDMGNGKYKIAYSMADFRYMYGGFVDPSYTILFKQKALPAWTVVQTDNTIESEIVLTRGDSGNETVACTEAVTTQSFDTDIQKATLRVATTGGASEYSVYLVNYGSDKVNVIKAVRNITGLGLTESKALVESADGTTPVLVKAFATAADAQTAKEALETAGATVQVIGNGSTTTRIFRDGVDVTAQGLFDSGYLCYEVTADNLANTTWVITTEPVMPNPFDVNQDGSVNMQDVRTVLNKYLD